MTDAPVTDPTLDSFTVSAPLRRLRFDQREWAGSIGDLGTDLPLILGMLGRTQLEAVSVLTMFGLGQIVTGLLYGLPMPLQPLKAMAALVIAGQATAEQLWGAGFAIGAVMLVLSLTGGLTKLAEWIPHPVVRGVQVGLALTLANTACQQFLPSMGAAGYALAAVAFVMLVLGRSAGKWWAGPVVVLLGLSTMPFAADLGQVDWMPQFRLPTLRSLHWTDIASGFVILALPQIPLSISNSVIATSKTVQDLFPDRSISPRRIGLTYAAINLIAPWFGGIPCCHGCGGLAGHYGLGARTGGSVVIYGTAFLVAGLLFASGFGSVIDAFPPPLLGVLLLYESIVLLSLVRDLAGSSRDWLIALIVGFIAFGVPQGYLIGVIAGLLLSRWLPDEESLRAIR